MNRVVQSIESLANYVERSKNQYTHDKCILQNAYTAMNDAKATMERLTEASKEAAAEFIRAYKDYEERVITHRNMVHTADEMSIDRAAQQLQGADRLKTEALARLASANKALNEAEQISDDMTVEYQDASNEFKISEQDYTFAKDRLQRAFDDFANLPK